MGEIPARLGELPPQEPIVVMCHAGSRSARVAQYLNDNGYPNAVNLAGGIDAWSVAIDPSVPRYCTPLQSLVATTNQCTRPTGSPPWAQRPAVASASTS